MLRCWRQSRHLTSSVGNRCLIGVARFSKVSQEELLVQHIQSHNRIFAQPTPDRISVPDGFPFYIESDCGASYIERLYKQDAIFIGVPIFHYGVTGPVTQMYGSISNGLDQFVHFHLFADPDYLGIPVMRISDRHSKHVGGSEKYLETKGIKPSTIRMLRDYMEKGIPPRHEEFPFEIRKDPEYGTLILRRKGEDEIVFQEVRSVGEDRILEELACLEVRDKANDSEDSVRELELYGFDYFAELFEEGEVGNYEEQVEDIGCLFMKIAIFYEPPHYKKFIQFDVFAFPDQIFVPRISLKDCEYMSLKGVEAYFKERGIHTGTTNFMINYLRSTKPLKPLFP